MKIIKRAHRKRPFPTAVVKDDIIEVKGEAYRVTKVESVPSQRDG